MVRESPGLLWPPHGRPALKEGILELSAGSSNWFPEGGESSGAIAITKPYKFIGFGAIAITKPYKSIGFDIEWCTFQPRLPHGAEAADAQGLQQLAALRAMHYSGVYSGGHDHKMRMQDRRPFPGPREGRF
jgi:hypothetical protein